MSQREVRTMVVDRLEVRAGEDGEGDRIVGHAAVFDRESDPIYGMFREQIRKGAFARALKEEQDVRALFNHDPSLVLGRTKSGTLRLAEDDTGLAVEIDPADTQVSRDLMESIRRGDVDQMSFAFRSRKEEWEEEGATDGMDLRTIVDVDLFDVSPVTFPAYPDTDVGLRAAADDPESRAEAKRAYEAWQEERAAAEETPEPEEAAASTGAGLSLRRARQRQAEAEAIEFEI